MAMAKLWFMGIGEDLKDLKPRDWSLVMCRSKLDLQSEDWHGTDPPRFGTGNGDAEPDHEQRYVVIEITPEEAQSQDWKPGFYVCRLTAKEAADRLGLIGG
jgi:hypothetical protein